jgi:hypothetical protein
MNIRRPLIFLPLLLATVSALSLTANCQPRQTRGAATAANVCVVNNTGGSDLGAKVNACDARLGSGMGEIRVSGGGTIATQIRLSDNRILRFSPGVYENSCTQTAIILGNNNTVTGTGHNVVIKESSYILKADPATTPLAWTVIQTKTDYAEGKTGVTSNIRITSLKIQGHSSGMVHSTPQTIALGNCHDCLVEDVWLNETRTIGMNAGGSSATGNFARNVTFRKNLFKGVGSQNISVVNGENVLIEENRVLTSGRSDRVSTQVIDIEPNTPTDRINNIQILRNHIDVRNSVIMSNNGIAFQNTVGAQQTMPSRISGNTVLGGLSSSNSWMPVGISLAGRTRDIEISNNFVEAARGPAFVFYPGGGGHVRPKVLNNRILNSGTGGGGAYAFEVGDTTGGVFENNEIVHDQTLGGNGQLMELGNSANNIYRNTRYQGNTFAGLSISPKSRQYGTIGNGVKTHPDR